MKILKKKNIKDLSKINTPYGSVITFFDNRDFPFSDMTVGFSTLNPFTRQNINHKFSQFMIYVLKGKCSIEIGNDKITLTPGDITLIPKNCPYKVINDNKDHVKIVYVATPLAKNPRDGHSYL